MKFLRGYRTNLKTFYAYRFLKGRICNILRMAKDIKLDVSVEVKIIKKKCYVPPGCPKGLSTISLERITVLSQNFQGIWS